MTEIRTPEPLRSAARVAWIDSARGGLIVLVVMFHVINLELTAQDGYFGGTADELLYSMIAALRPLRMPLFFVVSGMLASGAMNRPWSTVLRSRTLLFVYLYALWACIQGGVLFAADSLVNDGPRTGAALVRDVADSSNYLWFLLALAVYAPLCKALRRWPIPTVGVGLVLYLVSVEGWPAAGWYQAAVVSTYFVWFFCGAVLADRVAELARARGPILLGVGVVVFIAPQVVEFVIGGRVSALLGIASLGAVITGVRLFAGAARVAPRITSGLGQLGRLTLPIYVMHVPILALTNAVLHSTVDLDLSSPVAASAYALALTLGVIAACVGLHRVLARRAPFLFDLPRRRRS